MMEKKEKKFLTVAPFERARIKDLKFREAGRGCVAFDAFAHNDVTVVFRENVGSQHYHYKRDNRPHYTVIIGSHRNSRLKIEVDGKTVVDVVGIGLCFSSAFQSYWISIYDGLISIGKGRYPLQNLVFKWLDTSPNCSVQYQVNGEYNGNEDEEFEDQQTGYDKWGLQNFIESWEYLIWCSLLVRREGLSLLIRLYASIRELLSELIAWRSCSATAEIPFLLLVFVMSCFYLTKISGTQLGSLWALSSQFEVLPLVKQCEEAMERFKARETLESGETVELSYASSHTILEEISAVGSQ
ncbi:BTB/POZ domain-containing protein [Hibiscus syriacus]|uniref:BTB/POZ domain-containing protein n=1 Tax=Hibiscus syriacus TaxID=106335 RepID=A0A6A2WFS5_HIBSY|nr:BTB/POZ domain-containing protein [Hibiscus syriacus]